MAATRRFPDHLLGAPAEAEAARAAPDVFSGKADEGAEMPSVEEDPVVPVRLRNKSVARCILAKYNQIIAAAKAARMAIRMR